MSCPCCFGDNPYDGDAGCRFSELLELREAKARHLATIRMLSMSEATAAEVEELRSQNASLIAEVGTLRSRVADLLRGAQ